MHSTERRDLKKKEEYQFESQRKGGRYGAGQKCAKNNYKKKNQGGGIKWLKKRTEAPVA